MQGSLILVGIDFSDAAADAVARAREMARLTEARVVVMHAADREGWTPSAEQAGWLARVGVGAEEIVVRTGPAWLHLARYADESGAAMVVVSSHGRGGFQPVTPGSTTLMLLARVRVPVLVVPSQRASSRPQPAAPATSTRPTDESWRDGAARTPPLNGALFPERNDP